MNHTRTYLDVHFVEGETISLCRKDFHHELNVLRKKAGDQFIVFDGKGNSALVEVVFINNKNFEIMVLEKFPPSPREGILIDLGQALIKKEPFNFALQKATELGVAFFSPLVTERVVVSRKLNNSKRKMDRWMQTAKGACEQCGENWMPEITEPIDLMDWSIKSQSKTKLVLYPEAEIRISEIEIDHSVSLAIGPEGDFTETEIEILQGAKFIPVRMGKRILRAETAAISALSAIRYAAKEF